jgi:hypothetical protein
MLSLEMYVEEIDGVYYVEAPWLDSPVHGATFEDAYEKAIRARR